MNTLEGQLVSGLCDSCRVVATADTNTDTFQGAQWVAATAGSANQQQHTVDQRHQADPLAQARPASGLDRQIVERAQVHG